MYYVVDSYFSNFYREFLQFILRHYGHALQHGNKYIYQCMPRMLSLWLDFGSNVPDTGKKIIDVDVGTH